MSRRWRGIIGKHDGSGVTRDRRRRRDRRLFGEVAVELLELRKKAEGCRRNREKEAAAVDVIGGGVARGEAGLASTGARGRRRGSSLEKRWLEVGGSKSRRKGRRSRHRGLGSEAPAERGSQKLRRQWGTLLAASSEGGVAGRARCGKEKRREQGRD